MCALWEEGFKVDCIVFLHFMTHTKWKVNSKYIYFKSLNYSRQFYVYVYRPSWDMWVYHVSTIGYTFFISVHISHRTTFIYLTLSSCLCFQFFLFCYVVTLHFEYCRVPLRKLQCSRRNPAGNRDHCQNWYFGFVESVMFASLWKS